MIARLRGEVVRLDEDVVVIDVAGVGYEVATHPRALAALRLGDVCLLEIHTAVSDDAIRLFGLPTAEELRLFRLLLAVDRVGPRAALAILGQADASTLSRAIADADVALLTTVPGIGRKTAERVVLELRDKVGDLVPSAAPASSASSVVEAAVAALIGLGFREGDARRAVGAIDESEDLTVMVGKALRQLDRAAS